MWIKAGVPKTQSHGQTFREAIGLAASAGVAVLLVVDGVEMMVTHKDTEEALMACHGRRSAGTPQDHPGDNIRTPLDPIPDLKEALAGWIAVAINGGVYVDSELVLWALGVPKGSPRTPMQATRAAIAKLGE